MPLNGYWIECVPVREEQCLGALDAPPVVPPTIFGLYDAHLASIPDVRVVASSPDQAIERLRHKLRALGRYYRIKGEDLPLRDNPVKPPRNSKNDRGWISVYVQINEQDTHMS